MSEAGKRKRGPVRRLALRIALAAAILIAGSEAALQAGHLVALRRSDRAAESDRGAPNILCLGDSHTYGAGVAGGESYPAQLAELLHGQGYRVNVINLGAPGTNTSEIRRALPGLIDRFHPLAIVVLASVNNGWNRRDTAWADHEDGKPVSVRRRAADFLVTRVRLIRAGAILLHRLDLAGPKEEAARDRGGDTVLHFRLDQGEPPEAAYDRTLRDLRAIVATARARHAFPILMTYVTGPDFPFQTPNHLLRRIAAETNTPLADNDLALKPFFIRADGSADPQTLANLFFPDFHPRAPAYRLIAKNIALTMTQANLTSFIPKAPAPLGPGGK